MERRGVDAQFGERVRAERKHRGWTQPELAKMLSDKGIEPMGPVTISKIESGDRPTRLTEALRLAECFGVSVDALLGRTTDPRDDQAYARRVLRDIALRSAQRIADIANTLSERLYDAHGSGPEEWPAEGQRAWGAMEETIAALVNLAQSEEPE